MPLLAHNSMPHPAPTLKALSFFSGCMGLDVGLEAAGIEVLLASEIDPAARATIRANKPDLPLLDDVRNYSAPEIRREAGLHPATEIDLVVGGPPCQAFSSAGKRQGFQDERGNVFLKFIDLVLELQPRFLILENVRGLLSAPLRHRPLTERGKDAKSLAPEEQRGGALLHILNQLESAGYGVSFNLYNAANFGTPQKRERVILACSRDGKKLPYLTPTHSETEDYGLPKWRSLREALTGLVEAEQEFIRFPEKRLKYYRLLKAGQHWRDLPTHLHREALGGAYHAIGGRTGFYRRLAWDQPSPTIVTHPAMPATDLAHPEQDRPLSIQEYKRLQELPDDWVIAGKLLDRYRQIGNAVPCSLGRAIGQMLIHEINGIPPKIFPNFPYSRYTKTDDLSWRLDVTGQKPTSHQSTDKIEQLCLGTSINCGGRRSRPPQP